ncbi:hypothetical protein Phou_099570 [Phytohabitans houttuyneae]|uniref:RNA polymerase sigma factor 70 region 4 type 2 domain-containing protein n=1 Tax=Phytohabitans houttuyneae TaxID=1076126 RepID=A0A6V8KVF8_9ACTN|nr:hypothetical protein Phou_099570 [Phytohabitans houttuyneae]
MVSSEGGPCGSDPDEAACSDFAEFYTSTVRHTLRAIRSLAGDNDTAREAVQEAYVRILMIWPRRNTLPAEDNLRYTIVTARNVVLDGFRRDRRSVKFDEDSQVGEDDPNLVAVLEEMSLMCAVRALIDKWPERRRAVAIMYLLEGHDYAEIASRLDMAQSTVRSHVGKARDVLKPYLQRMEELDAEKGGRST